ncbi:MAG: hypothetical protein JXA21_14410 [Anaerolineae bacterium]|nr:hypothetical protein [Anaerolineae bacterium]
MYVNKEVLRYWVTLGASRIGLGYNALAKELNTNPGRTHHWFRGVHSVDDLVAVEVMAYFHARGAFPEFGEGLKALADMRIDQAKVKTLINSKVVPNANEKAFVRALEK